MHAFVVGDHEPIARQVRQVLLREGHDCPADHLLLVDIAADRWASASAGRTAGKTDRR